LQSDETLKPKMSKQLIDKQEQGKTIAGMNGSVKTINDNSYKVNFQSSNNSYDVCDQVFLMCISGVYMELT
jgi:hypothetical protein